jgi:hypothetical protein
VLPNSTRPHRYHPYPGMAAFTPASLGGSCLIGFGAVLQTPPREGGVMFTPPVTRGLGMLVPCNQPSDSRNWSRGGAVGSSAGFAPWPARRPGGTGGSVCPVLSDNSVVGHTRIHRIVAQGFDLAFQVSWKPRCGIHTHPRDGRPAPAGWRLREGEWHSPNEQFHGKADVTSTCAAFWNEPLWIEKEGTRAGRLRRETPGSLVIVPL